jgi:serine/alanine adding enzyme
MEFIEHFGDSRQWDEYVEGHVQGRFCHLSAYGCLEEVYGYTPRYLTFRKDGRVAGVLPLFEVRSLFLGQRLVSQPFSEYGGLLLNDNLSLDEVREIMARLREFTRSRGIRSLEMHGRQGVIGNVDWKPHLIRGNVQSCGWLPLDRPLDEIWANVITYQVRKGVQKAQRNNLTVVEQSDPDTLLRDFYPLYLRSMARLGAPPHSFRYFLRCKTAYGGKMRIFWARHGGTPIAGLLGFACGKRINIINIVSDERFWELRPNDLVHWEYIKWAHQAGYKYFDFGSIRYGGQLHYKKKWGCTIEDHAYYFLVASGPANDSAVGTFDSSSKAMKLSSSIWSRFVPHQAKRLIGPSLRKHLIR